MNKADGQCLLVWTTNENCNGLESRTDMYLLWCMALFQVHPKTRNVDQQANDGDYEEFYL